MGNMKVFITTFFNILFYKMSFWGYSISFFDIFIAGCILTVIGFFIGKIIFAFTNDR